MREQRYRPLITRSIVGQFEVDVANTEVLKLMEEFDIAVNDAVSSVAFVTAGFSYLRKHFLEVGAEVLKQTGASDPPINITTSDESIGFYARWRVSEILEKVRDDGLVGAQLGGQLIVFLFALWDEDFRKRFADAHGLPKKEDLQVPLFGDLRHMRNDIIHHRSVASSGNTGRCQMLRWFKPGEVIRPGSRHYFDLVTRFPWEILAAGPNASSGQPEPTGEDDDPS